MNFKKYFFNNALNMINQDSSKKVIIDEVFDLIDLVTERELIDYFTIYSSKSKSLSRVIKTILTDKLLANSWIKNQNMFFDDDYIGSKRFSFDFFKSSVNLEFAFNHESASAWILLKGQMTESTVLHNQVLSDLSIIITVDKRMKSLGGFDGAIGTYEKYKQYLYPMNELLTKPILIIGLEPASDFFVKHKQILNKKIGVIKEMDK